MLAVAKKKVSVGVKIGAAENVAQTIMMQTTLSKFKVGKTWIFFLSLNIKRKMNN